MSKRPITRLIHAGQTLDTIPPSIINQPHVSPQPVKPKTRQLRKDDFVRLTDNNGLYHNVVMTYEDALRRRSFGGGADPS